MGLQERNDDAGDHVRIFDVGVVTELVEDDHLGAGEAGPLAVGLGDVDEPVAAAPKALGWEAAHTRPNPPTSFMTRWACRIWRSSIAAAMKVA